MYIRNLIRGTVLVVTAVAGSRLLRETIKSDMPTPIKIGTTVVVAATLTAAAVKIGLGVAEDVNDYTTNDEGQPLSSEEISIKAADTLTKTADFIKKGRTPIVMASNVGVMTVVSRFLKYYVPRTNVSLYMKFMLWIGTYVLSNMIADRAKTYVEDFIDNVGAQTRNFAKDLRVQAGVEDAVIPQADVLDNLGA